MWSRLSVVVLFLLVVTMVSSSDNVLVNKQTWQIPQPGAEMPSYTVQVGDTITIDWQGTKNVYIQVDDTCNKQDHRLVGIIPPVTYEFQESDIGMLYFVSEVSGHCQQGLQMAVTVQPCTGTDCPTPPPTPSPTNQSSATAAMTGRWSVAVTAVVGALSWWWLA